MAYDHENERCVIVKMIKKSYSDDKAAIYMNALRNEIQILDRIQLPSLKSFSSFRLTSPRKYCQLDRMVQIITQ